VDIEVDGVSLGREDLLMLIIANGRVFGGGFQIAPRADLGDGRLDGMGFAPLGRVVEGMEVVRKIHQQPADGQSLQPAIAITEMARLR